MSQQLQDQLMKLWAATLKVFDANALPPYANHKDIDNKIDDIKHREILWDYFDLKYSGTITDDKPPSWMFQKYRVWYCNALHIIKNMLDNREFDGNFDYGPYRDYDDSGQRRWCDLMSGDWAWKQAVRTLHRDVVHTTHP